MICGTCKTLFVLKLVGDDERHRQYSIDARDVANVRDFCRKSHFFRGVEWESARRALNRRHEPILRWHLIRYAEQTSSLRRIGQSAILCITALCSSSEVRAIQSLLLRPNGPSVHLAKPVGLGYRSTPIVLRPEGPAVQQFAGSQYVDERSALQASRRDQRQISQADGLG